MITRYLETSALLSAVFGEPAGKNIQKNISSASAIVSSRLLKVESERALLRLVLSNPKASTRIMEARHELMSFLSRVNLIEISKTICDRASKVSPDAHLRTLDAIHLATYWMLKAEEPGLEMITLDARILSTLE